MRFTSMNRHSRPDATNPLLDFSGLARFGEIQPAHVTPAIDLLLQEARDAVIKAGVDDLVKAITGSQRAARSRSASKPRIGRK